MITPVNATTTPGISPTRDAGNSENVNQRGAASTPPDSVACDSQRSTATSSWNVSNGRRCRRRSGQIFSGQSIEPPPVSARRGARAFLEKIITMNIEPSPASPLPLQPGSELQHQQPTPMILTHIIHPFVEALQRKFSSLEFRNRHDVYYPPENPHYASFTVPRRLYEPRGYRDLNALDYFFNKYAPDSGAGIRLDLREGCYRAGSGSTLIHTYRVNADCDPAAERPTLEAQVKTMIEELGMLAPWGQRFHKDFHLTPENIARLLQVNEPESATA